MYADRAQKRGYPTDNGSDIGAKAVRTDLSQRSPRHRNDTHDRDQGRRRDRAGGFEDQFRNNKIQEDAQMRAWVAKEDDFVLSQSKKKAKLRVKDGRGNPIDWLAMTLSAITHDFDAFDEDEEEADMNVIDPTGLVETLDLSELRDLEKEIDVFARLETSRENSKYWRALKVICQQRQSSLQPSSTTQNSSTVETEIVKILEPKSSEQLAVLEKQVAAKLRSDEPIDVEYWQKLLANVKLFQAKAELRNMHEAAIKKRLNIYRDSQINEATRLRSQMSTKVAQVMMEGPGANDVDDEPTPELSIRPEDKDLQVMDEKDFVARFNREKTRIQTLAYVPPGKASTSKESSLVRNGINLNLAPNSGLAKGDTARNINYDREVARGFGEDEEIFTGEEEVTTQSKPQWAEKYRPRKPRYFNRVQMGYEWNKYNQTHYDHDNPPPKVVQGYKFNIFYPDLIDKTKAPTYRIEREGGRRRGQSFAPAGEEDTCLIRFISGPPYEDIAFRIVDKEWDFSAKRERGFRSSFDKGVLQLHFQLRKIYYRK